MSDEAVKYTLPESEIPTHWVNLMPDLPGEPSPPGAHEQAAVRAALRLLRPFVTDLPLDQKVTVRTVGVTCCLRLLARSGSHQAPVLCLFAETRPAQTPIELASANVKLRGPERAK